jgi:hypothetical protein
VRRGRFRQIGRCNKRVGIEGRSVKVLPPKTDRGFGRGEAVSYVENDTLYTGDSRTGRWRRRVERRYMLWQAVTDLWWNTKPDGRYGGSAMGSG